VRQARRFPDVAVVVPFVRVAGEAEPSGDPEPILARPGELAAANLDQSAAGARSRSAVDQAVAWSGQAVKKKVVHG
jgi:hypothetical protein